MVNSFFAKQNFDCKKNLGTLCTVGAPVMLGNTSGFAALVKKEAPQVIVTHCFLHHHALVSKTLPTILKEVLSTGVKVINFIKASALNHCVFKKFCQEMRAAYEILLYYTKVRWLSRGKILNHLIELQAEVSHFLKEKESPFSEQLDREEFIHGLAYLVDNFGHMNEVNLSIQGPAVTIMDAAERLQALLAKLPLWTRRLKAGNYANFPMLEEVHLQDRIESDKALSICLQAEICRHLDTLQNFFKGYFCSGDLKVEAWICKPFIADIDCINDEDFAKMTSLT